METRKWLFLTVFLFIAPTLASACLERLLSLLDTGHVNQNSLHTTSQKALCTLWRVG